MGLLDFFKKGAEKPVEKKPVNSGATHAKPTSYTIKSGDSLSKIAKKFYGDAKDWQKIYKANQDTIKDPNLIYPGQEIIIP
jgi:nucleoid-associated protein YgaU